MRAAIYMNVSETHICIYVYTHIYKRNLAYKSQPDRKTSEGSSSGERLYTYTYPKRIHVCIYIYIYIYIHTHTYIYNDLRLRITAREKDLRGVMIWKGGYINLHVHIWNAHTYMCICMHTHIYNEPSQRITAREKDLEGVILRQGAI